jgi:hypothetical protein
MAQFGLTKQSAKSIIETDAAAIETGISERNLLFQSTQETTPAEFRWYFAPSVGGDSEYHYHNVATCPDCGQGMIRLGSCLHCPLCGFSNCGI